MPELPEVETIRRDLDREFAGKKVKAVQITGARSVRRGTPDDLTSRLVGRTFKAAKRRGKYLVVVLDSGEWLVFHLRMSGQLLKATPKAPKPKHTHVVIEFTHGTQSTLAERLASRGSSCPLPTTRNDTCVAMRAAARIVSRPCNGINFPTNRHVNGCVCVQPGTKMRSSAPTTHTSTRRAPSSRKRSACACVSATTTSACAKALRSIRVRTRAGTEPGRKRPRSSTKVSLSETSGLKTTGRPRAARRAATRSMCPG